MEAGAESYRRFLEGEEDAMLEIVREYNDGLVLYLNSFVNNISVADELAEDTFVRLGLKKPNHKGLSAFKTWLYAIGRNLALDYLRRAAREKRVSFCDCTDLPDEELLEKRYLHEERKEELHRALRRLKPEYRQVLWLIYFEGMTGKETSRIMKKTVHSVETLAYRARRALKEELNREGFTCEDL